MERIREVALQAARTAAAVIRSAWKQARSVEYKGPVDLVTATDREAEAAIVSIIRGAFPDHQIVAEESTQADLERPEPETAAWYIDPLDGTVNFVHRVPHFAVAIAFARGQDVQFAVVVDPMRNEEFWAERGRGATLNGQPLSTSSVAHLGQALLATGFPYDRRDHAAYYLRFFRAFVERAQDVRRFGSAALDLCWVACGRYDGFWEWRLHPWDVAAGSLIVREAGGVVSDFSGCPLDLFGEQILAANARIHPLMLAVLGEQLSEGLPPAPPAS